MADNTLRAFCAIATFFIPLGIAWLSVWVRWPKRINFGTVKKTFP